MYINKILLFFVFISSTAFSQAKKRTDTIFVYEKVFVYKTKGDKISASMQFRGFDSIAKKRMSEVIPFKPKIVADTLLLQRVSALKKEDKKKGKVFAVTNYGVSANSLFSQEPGIKNYGGGIGVSVTKNIYNNKFFLKLEVLFSKIFSRTDTKSIDGYYITPDAVLFYQAKNVNTQQINLPILLYWKYRKIKPQLGIAFTLKQTELDFASYKNNTTFNLVQQTSFKLTNSYLDFMYGVEYELTKNMGVSIRSKQTLANLTHNKAAENLNSLESLHFFPNQVIFGVVYNFIKQ